VIASTAIAGGAYGRGPSGIGSGISHLQPEKNEDLSHMNTEQDSLFNMYGKDSIEFAPPLQNVSNGLPVLPKQLVNTSPIMSAQK